MCFPSLTPKVPKFQSQPLAVTDPNASADAAQREADSRARLRGFGANLLSTPESRDQGTVARKMLLGQ